MSVQLDLLYNSTLQIVRFECDSNARVTDGAIGKLLIIELNTKNLSI